MILNKILNLFCFLFGSSIFGAALFAAYSNFESEQTSWSIAFTVIALIFNPFVPLYLYDKFIWAVIDIGTGLAFIFNARIFKQ